MNLRDCLQQIYDTHSRLTPTLVVDTARDPGHPLHSSFEWDDAKAGPLYREVQAANLIRAVRVEYAPATDTTPARTGRAWVAPRVPDRPHEYVPVAEVAADPLLSKLVAAQMYREWVSMKRRWADFEEFWHMIRGDLAA